MNESLHIKIEHEDAITVKKDILLSEKNLLETIRYARNYNSLRKQELNLKENLKKQMGTINLLVNEIEKNLPKESMHYNEEKQPPQIPEVSETKKKQKKINEGKKSEVENQIEEIRARLASLGESY